MDRLGGKDKDEFRTAVVTTVVWVAGLTLVVIFAALFLGIWLDRLLETKPAFTIILMIISIPVTLFLTLRVVRQATAKIKPDARKVIPEEEPHRGKDE